MDTIQTIVATVAWLMEFSVVKGALAGAITAAWIDIAAFRKWQSWGDVVTYSWSLASFRWFQGAVIGGLTGLGFSF